MSNQSRAVAFLAYLLGLLGCLWVIIFRRKDPFAVYHAKQSLGLASIAIITPIIWGAITWILSWVPFLGVIVGIVAFSFVIAIYVLLGVLWIIGMTFALRGKTQPLPTVPQWAVLFKSTI